MKLSNPLLLGATALSLLVMTACGNTTSHQSSQQTQASRQQKQSSQHSKRIIVTSPCPGTTFYAFKEGREGIIGISDWLYKDGNKKILNAVIPETKKVNTSFITSDFKVNLESLINLKPDIIFYYHNYQNDGLQRAHVPAVDLGGKDQNPKTLQVLWEKKFCQTLGLPQSHKYAQAWQHTEQLVKPHKKDHHLKVLYINRLGKQIVVSAPGTTQDYYLKAAGLTNAATNLNVKGDAGRFVNVSMEQIYQWNPDMIIINFGSANDLLQNKISGQDWSKLKAVREQKVYSSPVGLHTWGNLGGDSPLMPLWLTNLVDPQAISQQKLRKETKKYYQKMFDYTLSDSMIDQIFQRR